jgi:hypothetical protein
MKVDRDFFCVWRSVTLINCDAASCTCWRYKDDGVEREYLHRIVGDRLQFQLAPSVLARQLLVSQSGDVDRRDD